MEKKLPETLFYNYRWHVYQTTNRESPAFFKTSDNLIKYKKLLHLTQNNDTFRTYLGREILTQRAIYRNETKVNYHETSYKTALTVASLSLTSLITITTTFLTALTRNSNTITTLDELDSNEIDDIKNTAAAFALSSSSTNNFTLPEVIDLINKALNKGIELTTSNLNNTLSVTKQSQGNSLDANAIIGVAFAVGVVATLTLFVFTIISLQKKSLAMQEKQLFDAQKKLIKRLPKIKLEIELKERVIKGMFKILGVEKPDTKSDEKFLKDIFGKYGHLIGFLDNQEDLNVYSELENKIQILLNPPDQEELINYKGLIFNNLKREIYNKLKKRIYYTFEQFDTRLSDFDSFYNEIDGIRDIPDRYQFMYESLAALINRYALVQENVPMANNNIM